MAVVNNPARSFVNLIVNTYDSFRHEDTPNIPDIFNAGLEDELKESSLKHFSERFSNPPLVAESDPPKPMTATQLDAEAVAQYKETAPTLSHLFALTGMLDAPLQDPSLQMTQLRIIEALAQDHLRNKQGYELDPMASMMQTAMAEMQGAPKPLPQFGDGKRRFYAQIFQEVFGRCSVESKKKIIKRLQPFEPVLNTWSSQFQRAVFRVERTFNDYLTNGQVKLGVSVAFGVVTYLAINKTIALSGQFFASPIFVSFSTVVINRMPVVIVSILSGAYTRIVDAVVYVASTRIYGYLFHSGKSVPFMIIKLMPLTSWVFYPVNTFAMRIFNFCYQSAFGPDALVQMGIYHKLEAKVLNDKCTAEKAQELLEGGMKAYQIWMYLVEQGPQKGLFEVS